MYSYEWDLETGGYLCSKLVYCSCGAKMHAYTSTNKGHSYIYYRCSENCGAPSVKMELIDHVATEYMQEFLSEENRNKLAQILRRYKSRNRDTQKSFEAAIKKRIGEKQAEYDALMKNLSSSALPAAVVSEIGKKMETLLEEIKSLEKTEPPEETSLDSAFAWLDSLKNVSGKQAIRLLIERIEVSQKDGRTCFSITSTLKSVLGKAADYDASDLTEKTLEIE